MLSAVFELLLQVPISLSHHRSISASRECIIQTEFVVQVSTTTSRNKATDMPSVGEHVFVQFLELWASFFSSICIY